MLCVLLGLCGSSQEGVPPSNRFKSPHRVIEHLAMPDIFVRSEDHGQSDQHSANYR